MAAFSQSFFLQALGWAVLNSLWQMAFLWIIYNVAVSIPKNVRSAHKSTLATAMLFAGFAWFIITFISIYSNRENNNAIFVLNGLSSGLNENWNNWLNSSLSFASVIYIALLSVPLIRFIKNYRYVQVLKKNNLSKIAVEWRMFVRRVGEQIGINKPVHIWLSDLVTSPVTIGFLKPIILVPLAAMNNLTSQQMEAVLLHELAHIKRYDYLINLLISFIQSILYFNPFVKAFAKTIETERERSCDEIVMQFQYDPHNYATALLTLEKNNTIFREMAIAASGKNDLLNRIERLLNIDTKPVFTFNKLAGLFAGLLCILVLNALIVVSKPAVQQKGSFVLEQLAMPFFLFDNTTGENPVNKSNRTNEQQQNAEKEIPVQSITNHITAAKNDDREIKNNEAGTISLYEDAPAINMNLQLTAPSFTTVNTIVAPELNKQDIKLVEQTVAATKKIVEEVQWKEVEKNIADVMTEVEKAKVKEQYAEQLAQANWEKLQNKLELSYDQLNWDKISDQITTAMINIKLDSLVKIYSTARENLDKAEKLAATTCDTVTNEMPIPDVSVENIRQRKEQIQKNLIRLKALRSKKIVHL